MPQPKKPNLQNDPVVDALIEDPSQAPAGTTVLTGYLGKSPTAGVWRLYLDPALTEYVEVPEEDIKHSETLPDASGTSIWVLNTTPLKHVRTQTQDVQAEFLGGAITDELLAAPGGPAPGPIGPMPTPQVSLAGPCISRIPCPSTANCPSVQVFCPSQVDACPSRLRPCISRIPCPSVPCPSTTAPCPTRIGCQSVATPCLSQQIRCNSAVDACPSRFGPCVTRSLNCPSFTALCQTIGIGCIPSRLVACPTDPNTCPQPSAAFVCPSFGPCPSEAGCPSEGFCDPGGGFDPGGQLGGGGIG